MPHDTAIRSRVGASELTTGAAVAFDYRTSVEQLIAITEESRYAAAQDVPLRLTLRMPEETS